MHKNNNNMHMLMYKGPKQVNRQKTTAKIGNRRHHERSWSYTKSKTYGTVCGCGSFRGNADSIGPQKPGHRSDTGKASPLYASSRVIANWHFAETSWSRTCTQRAVLRCEGAHAEGGGTDARKCAHRSGTQTVSRRSGVGSEF